MDIGLCIISRIRCACPRFLPQHLWWDEIAYLCQSLINKVIKREDSIKPFAPAESGERIDNTSEAVPRTLDHMAAAQIAVDKAGLLPPPRLAASGQDMVAIALAVRGKRIAFGRDDHG